MQSDVFSFWCLLDEEDGFLAYLESTGPVMAMEAKCLASPEGFHPRPLREFIEATNPRQLAMGLHAHILKAPIETVSDQGRTMYVLSVHSSATILYRRGGMRNGRLTPVNLSAYWSFPNSDLTAFISKSSDYLSWAKGVFRWARKFANQTLECDGFKYPATPKVKLAVRNSAIQIARF